MNCYRLEEIFIGLSCQFQIEITEEKMNDFYRICKDENPLHMNIEYAKERGFENRVVYGMLTSTFISTMVGMYLPGENSLLQSVHCDFLKPVYIGDKLTITGTVESIHKSVKQIGMNISILNQDNIRVVKGKAAVLLI